MFLHFFFINPPSPPSHPPTSPLSSPSSPPTSLLCTPSHPPTSLSTPSHPPASPPFPFYPSTSPLSTSTHFFALGFGKFMSNETGITYTGSWRDGLKDGMGALFFPSGDELNGRWSEVRCVTGVLN